jgi:hypothetical protein
MHVYPPPQQRAVRVTAALDAQQLDAIRPELERALQVPP